MATITHLTGSEPGVKRILRSAGYNGRRITFRAAESVPIRGTYWDEGRRTTYSGVNLQTGQVATIPHFDPPQFGGPVDIPDVPVKPGMVIVAVSEGAYSAATIICNPVDAPQLLPIPTEVTEDERIVLSHTSGLKSSYAGIKNYRFREAARITGISLDRWDAAKLSLIGRKLLNKAGAITPAGRNAL